MEKIKESLESGNTIVVCDTNVYLHIYSYSPNYSEYAISCLDVIKDYLRMPSMIALEYTKHYQYCFKQMGNRIIDAKNNYIRQITKAQDSTLSVNMNLKKLGFVEIKDLNESLNQQYATMMNTVIEFFENRGGALDLLANGWGEVDRVYEIYEYMVNNNQILSAFSQLDLYRICEEGARRYKKQLPPGYKDDNGKKNGFNKYGDLIWWKEVGLDVQLYTGRTIESNNFYVKIQADDPEIDMFAGGWGTGYDPNPSNLFGETAKFNFSRYVNEKGTEIMKKISSTDAFDDAKNKEFYKEWQAYAKDEAFMIPTLVGDSVTAVNKRVKYYDTSIATSGSKSQVYQIELTSEDGAK